ncbi:glycosyltransferase family 2 protein [Patescibacteria group bacterium]|nr:glycosyltransferase family 2 protein [Patescibacteria group bacterium]MBU4000190.1 glycosyltransferase family 2 protein [Patescibacteria group bacterium]MBU4057129.1 glycosyltransferase family 2 protein [Patescibacteria group bacterium]MBU4369074.1 glycosyltransferase family 2 protein [Patescibacteria group bacterium]
MSTPKVSIIILNWNGWQDTLECLDSLAKIDYPNYEIIVVDNGSTDESAEKIKIWINTHKSVISYKLLVNSYNAGFAGGNNVGIKYALKNGADYVLLLNNDTLVEPNFLSELVKIGESDKKIGLIGSKIYFYPPIGAPRVWFAGGKINWLKTRGSHLNYSQTDKEYEALKVTDYLTGCCLLIKREVIEKIGGLSDDYFLYYEDTDYCLQAREAGWQCALAPESHIWHKISRSTKEFSPSYLYYHARNGLMMAKRANGGAKIFLVYIFSAYLAAKQIVKYLFCPAKRQWARMILLGIYDFWRNKAGKMAS